MQSEADVRAEAGVADGLAATMRRAMHHRVRRLHHLGRRGQEMPPLFGQGSRLSASLHDTKAAVLLQRACLPRYPPLGHATLGSDG